MPAGILLGCEILSDHEPIGLHGSGVGLENPGQVRSVYGADPLASESSRGECPLAELPKSAFHLDLSAKMKLTRRIRTDSQERSLPATSKNRRPVSSASWIPVGAEPHPSLAASCHKPRFPHAGVSAKTNQTGRSRTCYPPFPDISLRRQVIPARAALNTVSANSELIAGKPPRWSLAGYYSLPLKGPLPALIYLLA